MSNRPCWLILIPTASMVAAVLTKSVVAPQMRMLLSAGCATFQKEGGQRARQRSLPLQGPMQETGADKSHLEVFCSHRGPRLLCMLSELFNCSFDDDDLDRSLFYRYHLIRTYISRG